MYEVLILRPSEYWPTSSTGVDTWSAKWLTGTFSLFYHTLLMILATHVHLLIFQIENKNYKGIIRMISASKD